LADRARKSGTQSAIQFSASAARTDARRGRAIVTLAMAASPVLEFSLFPQSFFP